METRSPRRLWKEVGTTKQKFDRQSERSPSFDRSSLAKSREGRSVSSHQGSINKRSQFKHKVQSKVKLEQALNNFCAQINELGVQLMEVVPEQQDFQSLKNSQISMRNELCLQNKADHMHQDQIEIDLLNEIFQKHAHRKGPSRSVTSTRKVNKEKIVRVMHLVRQIQVQHAQAEKMIKYFLDNFRVEKRKNDRVIRQIVNRMTKGLCGKDEQISRLQEQNYELKEQLSKAYDAIEQLQKWKLQHTPRKEGRFKTKSSEINYDRGADQTGLEDEQSDNKTVKVKDNKDRQRQKQRSYGLTNNNGHSFKKNVVQVDPDPNKHRRTSFIEANKKNFPAVAGNLVNSYFQQSPSTAFHQNSSTDLHSANSNSNETNQLNAFKAAYAGGNHQRPQTHHHDRLSNNNFNNFAVNQLSQVDLVHKTSGEDRKDTLSNRQKFKRFLNDRRKKDQFGGQQGDPDNELRNSTECGAKDLKYQKQTANLSQATLTAQQTKPVSSSTNVNSIKEKFYKKTPVVPSIKKQSIGDNASRKDLGHTRADRLKSDSFFKYNAIQNK